MLVSLAIAVAAAAVPVVVVVVAAAVCLPTKTRVLCLQIKASMCLRSLITRRENRKLCREVMWRRFNAVSTINCQEDFCKSIS